MDDLEEKIRDYFEQNYQLLQLEGGHALTADAKELALNQVLMYWKKLQDIAKKVTDAEVRLSLPNQKTPKGRTFSIEGVVDIVREEEMTGMYDVKTHDLEYIEENKKLYEEQLNVYAYIWQGLRRNKLDYTAVISTNFSHNVKQALRSGDAERLAKAIGSWNPVVPIIIDKENVKNTIESFGEVVDDIESGVFTTPMVEALQEKIAGTKQTFATKICANCDGRFSCDTYRDYSRTSAKGKAREFVKYYEPSIDREEQEDWLEANSNIIDDLFAGRDET